MWLVIYVCATFAPWIYTAIFGKWPDLVILLPSFAIALIAWLALHFYIEYYCAKRLAEMESKSWINKMITLWVPVLTLFSIKEELLYRFPLLVLFKDANQDFWHVAIGFSIIFGLGHWHNDKVLFSKQTAGFNNGQRILYKLSNVLVTGLLGLGFSYCLITTRSIWITIMVHTSWNILLPLIASAIYKFVIRAKMIFLNLRDIIDKYKFDRKFNRS